MMMRAPLAFTLLGSVALSGCSLLHSNIKGGFICNAPKGNCAPSIHIDDDALKAIGANEAGVAPESNDVAPKKNNKIQKDRVFIQGMRPALRIVYPAWRDSDRHIHPRSSAYVNVDAPRINPSEIDAFDAVRLGTKNAQSLLEVAEMAPLLGQDMASAEQGSKTNIFQQNAMAQDAQAHIPPASYGAKAPTQAIKDEVKAILERLPKPPASSPVITPATRLPATKQGISFPPTGN